VWPHPQRSGQRYWPLRPIVRAKAGSCSTADVGPSRPRDRQTHEQSSALSPIPLYFASFAVATTHWTRPLAWDVTWNVVFVSYRYISLRTLWLRSCRLVPINYSDCIVVFRNSSGRAVLAKNRVQCYQQRRKQTFEASGRHLPWSPWPLRTNEWFLLISREKIVHVLRRPGVRADVHNVTAARCRCLCVSSPRSAVVSDDGDKLFAGWHAREVHAAGTGHTSAVELSPACHCRVDKQAP